MNIKKFYDQLAKYPFGKWLFSKSLAFIAPYSGTIHPEVMELRPGFCRLAMNDRRQVRNHLKSIHAIALMNIGEMVTGLPLLYTLPAHGRTIIVKLEMEYIKKARGRLEATCQLELPPREMAGEDMVLEGIITNSQGEVVAKSRATWRVDNRPKKTEARVS